MKRILAPAILDLMSHIIEGTNVQPNQHPLGHGGYMTFSADKIMKLTKEWADKHNLTLSEHDPYWRDKLSDPDEPTLGDATTGEIVDEISGRLRSILDKVCD